MPKCIISYWMGSCEEADALGFEHRQEVDYSNRHAILDQLLAAGLSVMFSTTGRDSTLYINVDTRRFSQR